MFSPTIAVLGAGAMGSKVALRLRSSGAGPILTNLDGRSPATRERATHAGMIDAPYADIVAQATHVLSIVPTQEARAVAALVAGAYRAQNLARSFVFIDCNAVAPGTMREIAHEFAGTGVVVVDGSIIGTPPSDTFNPGIYLSADEANEKELDEAVDLLKKLGLNPFPLKGLDASIGAASALKMSHSGIVKGLIGLFYMMILSADRTSPATTTALLHALQLSQPALVDRAVDLVPASITKAYRHIYEMREVGAFVGGDGVGGSGKQADETQQVGEGQRASEGHQEAEGRQTSDPKPHLVLGPEVQQTFQGIEALYRGLARANEEGSRECDVLREFADAAKRLQAGQ